MENFTKSDLKPGMVVEYRNGDRRIILETEKELILSGNYGCSVLSSYSQNLLKIGSNLNLDIVKVYFIKDSKSLESILNLSNLKLIWERKETVELTLQQIADKFNVPVENIKIKD